MLLFQILNVKQKLNWSKLYLKVSMPKGHFSPLKRPTRMKDVIKVSANFSFICQLKTNYLNFHITASALHSSE